MLSERLTVEVKLTGHLKEVDGKKFLDLTAMKMTPNIPHLMFEFTDPGCLEPQESKRLIYMALVLHTKKSYSDWNSVNKWNIYFVKIVEAFPKQWSINWIEFKFVIQHKSIVYSQKLTFRSMYFTLFNDLLHNDVYLQIVQLINQTVKHIMW